MRLAVKFLKDFDERYNQYRNKLLGSSVTSTQAIAITGKGQSSSTPIVYYNNQTGVGYANNKRFKFKNNQPEFAVFAEIYKNIGTSIKRVRVLELSGLAESETGSLIPLNSESKQKKSFGGGTYFINELAKKMRERTSLTPDHIVNNNGDLTLVGVKIESPPK